ncbi:MAG: hypothetical protein ACQESK_03155 [Bacteroidota bacterium]
MKLITFSLLSIFLIPNGIFAQNWLDNQCQIEDKTSQNEFDKSSDRNTMQILINQEGKILLDEKDVSYLDDAKFKELIYSFIENPSDSNRWAKKPQKAIISLQHYQHPEVYEQVLTNIREVYYYLWNNLAKQDYQTNYEELNCKEREKIQKKYPYQVFDPSQTSEKENDSDMPQFKGPPAFEDVKDN